MIPSAGRILRGISAAIVAATFSACAIHGPAQPQFLSSQEQTRVSTDPMEEVNRSVFERNQQFNHAVIYPTAKTYRDTVPEPIRDSINAFTANLNEPVVFANNILQLRFPAATTTFGRFLMNSTIGIGGLVDVAAQEGLARQTGDFGQTLYVWGIRNSEFIVVPVVGPSNVRDALGSGVELGAQIFLGTILPLSTAKVANYIGTAGTVASPIASLSKFDEMQELEQNSLNFYAMMRSVIEQKRQAELRGALKQSLLSALAGPEDASGGDAGALLVSPALSSPALQSPASSSPALEGPSPVSPSTPVGELKEPRAEATSSGWTLVVERQPARE
jgi:phospholipid-binding lipoprotein MlaA